MGTGGGGSGAPWHAGPPSYAGSEPGPCGGGLAEGKVGGEWTDDTVSHLSPGS